MHPVAAIPQLPHDGAPATARRCPVGDDEKTATVEIKRRVWIVPQLGQKVSESRCDMDLRTEN